MVVVKNRLFCVIGISFSDRSQAIEKIKNNILKNKNRALNVSVLYGRGLTLPTLKEVVYSYSFDGDRVIILKEADYLSPSLKEFFLQEFEEILTLCYIIFEIDKNYGDFIKDKNIQMDNFFQTILKRSLLTKLYSYKDQISMGSFVYALRKSNIAAALHSLERLFLEGKHESSIGLQVLGVLVREFSSPRYQNEKLKYLKLIWETDRLMKDKGVEPKVALGTLVTKLLEH
jgi:hypothetical protein